MEPTTQEPSGVAGGHTSAAGALAAFVNLSNRVGAGEIPDDVVAMAVAGAATAILDEARRTPRFRRALLQALQPLATEGEVSGTPGTTPARRGGRRSQGALDPYGVLAETGEDGLRSKLAALRVEQLKDIIAQHGMDRDRLAMKWKDEGRLIDRIVETAVSRATKGDAFRSDGDDP